MRKKVAKALVGLGLAGMLGAGCASPTGPASVFQSGGAIQQLNLITVPVGLNLDNEPGPDGFSVKVYANDDRNPKAVPIDSGTLEILMFNGTFYGKTEVPPPLKIWTFPAGELDNYRFESGIGEGYEFVLAWGTNRPTEAMISVAARYTGRVGVVTSRPSSVTVLNR